MNHVIANHVLAPVLPPSHTPHHSAPAHSPPRPCLSSKHTTQHTPCSLSSTHTTQHKPHYRTLHIHPPPWSLCTMQPWTSPRPPSVTHTSSQHPTYSPPPPWSPCTTRRQPCTSPCLPSVTHTASQHPTHAHTDHHSTRHTHVITAPCTFTPTPPSSHTKTW